MEFKVDATDFFWDLGLQTIKELETDKGILASSSQEIYGCIFGRDSLITALKLLKASGADNQRYFLDLVKKILANLVTLQGHQVNIESGEEPGKCIHEYRPDNHEHLTKRTSKPWFVYADNTMRNYDSVDATPLLLITIYRYWQKSGDDEFLQLVLPNIDAALKWQMAFSDKDNDGLIDYQPHPERTFGGLVTQNWMDSVESVFHEDGSDVVFPVAPVEVQAYGYLAYRLWADYFHDRNKELSLELNRRADKLKEVFNRKFVFSDNGNFALACGVDGAGKQMQSVRSSMGHVLWASRNLEDDGILDCILQEEQISELVQRLIMPDLFEPEAGIRTLSANSAMFSPQSYHNGSIWPHDNGLIAEGLQAFGYTQESKKIRESIFRALGHFQTPVELFVFHQGQFSDYFFQGQTACKKQAWSAASLLTTSLALKK